MSSELARALRKLDTISVRMEPYVKLSEVLEAIKAADEPKDEPKAELKTPDAARK